MPTVFAEIQALSDRSFTLDAAASDSGDNTHCANFCSPSNSFLSQQHTGHIWINAPFTQLTAFLQHYLHCKQLAPDTTSACILVPGYLLPVLKPLLSGMRLLKRFTKGAAIFEQFARSGNAATSPGVQWPVYIYTDVPSAAHAACDQGQPVHGLNSASVTSAAACPEPPDERLAMLFEGGFQGQDGARIEAPVLLDSGASSNFVSPRLLRQLALSYSSSSAKLRLANNSEVPILGKVRLRVKLQNFTVTVACHVTDLCGEFDLILGNSFMIGHLAVLDYCNFTASFHRDGKLFTVTPSSVLSDRDTSSSDQLPNVTFRQPGVSQSSSTRGKASSKLENSADQQSAFSAILGDANPKHFLSCAQARRSIKRGCRSFLVLVNPADSAATLAAASASDSVDTSAAANSVDAAEQADLHKHIDSLQHDFADVFQAPSGLPPDRGVEHVIPLLPDSQPPFQRMYRLSPSELQEVQRQITDLLSKQLIEPSVSPYGAPILFVEKKTGELRMVVDYRALNKVTVKNRYPLPRIDDLFDKLFGAKYFSCLDAASGFHQILLKDDDKPKTAFRTPFGHYQFRVLPFGLTNAPGTFQGVMNNVFNPPKFCADGSLNPKHRLSDFSCVFIDDILVFSKTAAEHKEHLETVLSELRDHKLLIKPSKCVWGQTELPYLGHIIGQDGVKPDPKKVQSVFDWPRPTCVREVQQFLGLTNFFTKYIQGYANLTKPLTDLSKKNVVFAWTDGCNLAFNALKQALTSAPVLALPDPAMPFELVCDASGFGIGAVLMQQQRPVAYYSRKMVPAERNYVVTEQELLATVEALRVFRCYLLLGQQFSLVTDNKPNTFLETQPTLSRRQARWSEYLQRFHFVWVHRPGRHNVADPLSRNPSFLSVNALLAATTRSAARPSEAAPNLPSSSSPATAPATDGRAGKSSPATGANTVPVCTRKSTAAQQPPNGTPASAEQSSPSSSSSSSPQSEGLDTQTNLVDDISQAYAADPFFADDTNTANMSYIEGLWWKDGRIVVPDSEETKLLILQAMHDDPLAGHFSVAKTLKAINHRFFWKRAGQEVSDYIRHCPSCQANKVSSSKPAGLLQPLDVPPSAWHTVTTDYITGLPLTPDGHNAIAVFVDKLTKYVYAVPCSTTSDATDWALMYVEHVMKHQGLSEVIISDRGPQFISTFNKTLATRLGIKWNLSTARHPQTDGQTERVNRVIEDVLRHFVSPNMLDWDRWLCLAQFAINNAWHETTQQTPFFLNLGRAPRTPLDILLPNRGDVDNPASCNFAGNLQQLVARARKLTIAAQQRQKRYYDAKHVLAVFAVNDEVLLSTSGLQLKISGTNKLAPKFIGPFKVLERYGSVAYKLSYLSL